MEAKPPAPLGPVLPDVLALEAALVFVEQRQILFRLVLVPLEPAVATKPMNESL